MRMAAAERESDDDDLVRAADLASRTAKGPWRDRFEKKVSVKRRIAGHQGLRGCRARGGPVRERAHGSRAHRRAVARAPSRGGRAGPRDVRARGSHERARAPDRCRSRKDEQAEIDARVEAWLHVAQLRERRGDVTGAAESLRHAARLDPAPLERWSQLERVAALAGNAVGTRGGAQRDRVARRARRTASGPSAARARLRGGRSILASVEAHWQRVLDLRPDDEEADFAIEELYARKNEHGRLAEHLEKRAERLGPFPGPSRDATRRASAARRASSSSASACSSRRPPSSSAWWPSGRTTRAPGVDRGICSSGKASTRAPCPFTRRSRRSRQTRRPGAIFSARRDRGASLRQSGSRRRDCASRRRTQRGLCTRAASARRHRARTRGPCDARPDPRCARGFADRERRAAQRLAHRGGAGRSAGRRRASRGRRTRRRQRSSLRTGPRRSSSPAGSSTACVVRHARSGSRDARRARSRDRTALGGRCGPRDLSPRGGARRRTRG